MGRHFVKSFKTNVKQLAPVYVHEIASYVHLQDIALAGIVAALAQDMLLQPSYPVMGAFFLYAAVGVVDERALEHLVRVVEIKVMHHTVSEVRREHLPRLGLPHYEAVGMIRLVGAAPQRVAQFVKVFSESRLETELRRLVALVPAGIVIGRVKVFKKFLSR